MIDADGDITPGDLEVLDDDRPGLGEQEAAAGHG
jgi:hypothetical protein